jgi:zinc D-Ala-D-Ala carboxypeptidase
MHLQAAFSSRKYRLRNKARFGFIVTAAILFVVGLVCVVAGLSNKSSHAMTQAKAPSASKSTGGTLSNPSSVLAADNPASSPVSNISNEKQLYGSIHTGDWRLVLVNASHPLPDGFQDQTSALKNGLQFDSRAIDDLRNMIRDGSSQGLSFIICSAYRSTKKQKELFDQQVAVEEDKGLSYDQAVETTKTKVALPGTSEHNLGLAVDIVALSYQKLDEGYTDTPECKWLQNNCWKYGFIQRYPQNKSSITKIIFEPWHYRYVGVEAATEISQTGICLEEYLHQVN